MCSSCTTTRPTFTSPSLPHPVQRGNFGGSAPDIFDDPRFYLGRNFISVLYQTSGHRHGLDNRHTPGLTLDSQNSGMITSLRVSSAKGRIMDTTPPRLYESKMTSRGISQTPHSILLMMNLTSTTADGKSESFPYFQSLRKKQGTQDVGTTVRNNPMF